MKARHVIGALMKKSQTFFRTIAQIFQFCPEKKGQQLGSDYVQEVSQHCFGAGSTKSAGQQPEIQK